MGISCGSSSQQSVVVGMFISRQSTSTGSAVKNEDSLKSSIIVNSQLSLVRTLAISHR